jgi:hypothetical protein
MKEYITVLDNAQAFQIIYLSNHEKQFIELNNQLKELYKQIQLQHEAEIKTNIDKINDWILNEICNIDLHNVSLLRDYQELVERRHYIFNFEQRLAELDINLRKILNKTYSTQDALEEMTKLLDEANSLTKVTQKQQKNTKSAETYEEPINSYKYNPPNGNQSVTKLMINGRYTENNKLIKERTCLICSSRFKSNRKNSMYCSDKCKQAAYRERKESNQSKEKMLV